jgi:hypothetical protein
MLMSSGKVFFAKIIRWNAVEKIVGTGRDGRREMNRNKQRRIARRDR